MSLDRSLKSANALIRHRNVLRRPERLARLIDEGKWDEQQGILGLPKVANRKVVVGGKSSKKEAAAEGATEEAASAPAAGKEAAAKKK